MILRDLDTNTRAISVPGHLYTSTLTIVGGQAGRLVIRSNFGGFIIRDEPVDSIAQANVICFAENAPRIEVR